MILIEFDLPDNLPPEWPGFRLLSGGMDLECVEVTRFGHLYCTEAGTENYDCSGCDEVTPLTPYAEELFAHARELTRRCFDERGEFTAYGRKQEAIEDRERARKES